MPLPYAAVAYPLTGGQDQKIHGLVLPPPKLQRCVNAFVNLTGSLRRRYGLTALSGLDMAAASLGNSQASATYQGRLLNFTQSNLYDYSESALRWSDKGQANSWRLRARSVDAGDFTTLGVGARDMARIDGYRCYAYEYFQQSGANYITRVAFSLTDDNGARFATNQVLVSSSAIASPRGSAVRVVKHGVKFYIVYWDVSTTTTIKCFLIDTTSAASITTSLAGAATSLATDYSPELNVYGTLDLCASLHGPMLAYRSTGTVSRDIKFGLINTSGALTLTQTVTAAVKPYTIAIDAVSGGAGITDLAITWSDGSAPSDIYCTLRRLNVTTWSTLASSTAMDTALTTAAPRQLGVIWESATLVRVYYDTDVNVTYQCVRQGTFNTSGTIVSQDKRLNRSYMASKPFIGTDGATWCWVINEEATTLQPALFLMRSDGWLGACANKGTAVRASQYSFTLPHVVVGLQGDEGNSYSIFVPYYTRIDTAGTSSVTAGRELTVDMAHLQSHVGVEDGACFYLPGGFLHEYDGFSCTELGFLVDVDTQNRMTLTGGTVTGSMTSSQTYAYRACFEWTNAQGERQQSTDFGAKTVVMGAADKHVTIVTDCIPWTLKQALKATPRRQKLSVAFYRSVDANPTASASHHRVGSVEIDPTADTVTFVDNMSDTDARLQEQYINDIELDAVANEGGYILAAGNGRVFQAGFPSDPNLIRYSKLRGHGQALSFNDSLQIQIPTSNGVITGMRVFAESLVITCERAIYRVNGGGASNTGVQGGFTDPVLIQADDGGLGQRGMVVTPMGLMYEGSKGIMLMLPSFQVSYIGAQVETDFASAGGAALGATLLPVAQQVRFSYATFSLVYDYYHQQWYQFSMRASGPTCAWQGTWVSERSYEDSTSFRDGSNQYAVELTLGWFHASSLLGDIDVRFVGLIGQVLGACYIHVEIAKNQQTANQEIDVTKSTPAALNERWRVKDQVVSEIQIFITDATQDQFGQPVIQDTAGFQLNELTFEVALRSPRIGRSIGAGSGGGGGGV